MHRTRQRLDMLESADAMVTLGVRRVFQKLKSKCTEGNRLYPDCTFVLKQQGLGEVRKDRQCLNEHHVFGKWQGHLGVSPLPRIETQRQAGFCSKVTYKLIGWED